MDNRRAMCVIASAIIIIISQIYCVRTFILWRTTFSHQYELLFRARRPRQINTLCACIIIGLFVERPVSNLVAFQLLPSSHGARVARVVLNEVFVVLVVFCFVLYGYHLFYDLGFARFLLHRRWVIYLEDGVIQRNFFAKYKKTLGSWRYTVRWMFVWWMIVAGGDIYGTVIDTNASHALATIMFAIGMASALIFVQIYAWKAIDIQDSIGIHKQVNFVLKLSVLLFFMWLINVIVFAVTHDNNVKELIGTVVVCGAHVACTYGAIDYVKHIGAKIEEEEEALKQIQTEADVSLMAVSPRDMLGDELFYEKFMNHLLREFSFENLLFVTEVTQYKEHIRLTYPDVFSVTQDWESLVILPNEIPMSTIVFESSFEDFADVARVFILLCEKYVDTSSELSLNLAYCTRRNLIEEVGRLENGDLDVEETNPSSVLRMESIFDDALNEVFGLIRDSLLRFDHSASVWEA